MTWSSPQPSPTTGSICKTCPSECSDLPNLPEQCEKVTLKIRFDESLVLLGLSDDDDPLEH